MNQEFSQGYAVIVGVGSDLPGTVKDAEALKAILTDAERCAYSPNNVKLLVSGQATRQKILSALDYLSEAAGAESTVIIYFSGHGYRVTSSLGVFYYLMAYGYDLGNLYQTAISGDEFTRKLEKIKSKKLVVLLDCCHAGGLGEPKAPGFKVKKSPLPPEALALLSQGSGRAIIASSMEDELSYTGDPYSAFTLALVEALSGIGVAKKDGYVRLADLALHAREVVPKYTAGKQHPTLNWEKGDNFRLAYYAGGSSQPKGLPFTGKPKIELPSESGIRPAEINIDFYNPNWKVGASYQARGDIFINQQPSKRQRRRKPVKPKAGEKRNAIDEVSRGLPTLVKGGAKTDTFSQLEDYIEKLDAKESEEKPPRFVNVCIGRQADKTVLPKSSSLAADREYKLRINIGDFSPESVVENAKENPLRVDLLPESKTGYCLEVVAASDDFIIPKCRHNLFLPVTGESWVCDCPPETEHSCSEKARSRYLFIDIRSPEEPCIARLRLAIYYKNNLIQSQLLTAQVLKIERNGELEAKRRKTRYHSYIDYTLTASLRDLSFLPARTLNILTNANADGTHKIVINGKLDDVIAFNLTEGQMRNAINAVREKLVSIHVEKYGGHLGAKIQYKSLYDANNSKKKDAFINDLKQLAPLGRRLWDLLLQDKPDQRRKLRDEILKKPSTIQVSRTAGSKFIFPWALVYDIPLESNIKKFIPCRFLGQWEGASNAVNRDEPACPYEAEHAKNTICPFGFWGFKHIIEQPPSMPEGRNLPVKISSGNQPPDLIVGISKDLDEQMTAKHLNRIKAELKQFSVEGLDSLDSIEAALAQPKLEVVYFYCHGRREELPGATEPIPYLGVGTEEMLSPGDIITWDDADWDERHWRDTSPLVFINGCHTAELTPESLASFVDAFAGAYAAGVIGTEILMHQQVASEAGFEFLNQFQNRNSVGKALQWMRIGLLLKGNLMGLAYTPYCSAELQLS